MTPVNEWSALHARCFGPEGPLHDAISSSGVIVRRFSAEGSRVQ